VVRDAGCCLAGTGASLSFDAGEGHFTAIVGKILSATFPNAKSLNWRSHTTTGHEKLIARIRHVSCRTVPRFDLADLARRVVYSLLIINKAGGLVYDREFSSGLQRLASNDKLILAGTFHSVHAITRGLIPISLAPQNTAAQNATNNFPLRASGLEVLESSDFRLTCFETLTGTKFMLFTEPTRPNVDVLIKKVYELYADYVMKNPFYTIEMPIRCQKFDAGLDREIKARG
jgi:hypothetical protein